jgi:hypothetical protein
MRGQGAVGIDPVLLGTEVDAGQAEVDGKVRRLVETLGEVLDRAGKENRATNRVADEIARARIGR